MTGYPYLIHEQLDVRIEQVSFSDVNALAEHIVDELHNTRHDGGFPNRRHVRERSRRCLHGHRTNTQWDRQSMNVSTT